MKRSAIAAATGCLIAVVAWAGVAWACTAVASVDIEGRSGAPGSRQMVRGLKFEAGPVELRWNAVDGPLAATATGPRFSVPVAIPENARGVLFLVAVQHRPNGKVWQAPDSFEVLAPGESPSTPQAEVGPSIADTRPEGRTTGSLMALGAGLLSIGGVVLVGAMVAVAQVRRRSTAILDARP